MVLFWEQGYEATGVAQLSEVMGIARQSLYGAFGSKRGLFDEALAHYDATRLCLMRTTLDGPGTAREKLRTLFDLWIADGEGWSRGCLLSNSIAELPADGAGPTATLQRMATRQRDVFLRLFRQARTERSLRRGLAPEDAADLLSVFAQGVSVINQLNHRADAVRRATAGLERALFTG